MPNLDWNCQTWDGEYDWTGEGEEWSDAWGGSYPQWMSSILPRLNPFIPAASILEIAPGFGRWSRFLIPSCQNYIGVDLSAECIGKCRERFAEYDHAQFVQNDGTSLEMVPDCSMDLVFSFDSLVHVELDILEKYIGQIILKLTPDNGVGFIHHSNWAGLSKPYVNQHYRAETVSAGLIANAIDAGGGKLLIQEQLNWGIDCLSDCFSVFSRKEAFSSSTPICLENSRFMDEAQIIKDIHSQYATLLG